MNDSYTVLISSVLVFMLLCTGVLLFLIGYLCGKSGALGVSNTVYDSHKRNNSVTSPNKYQSIDIDESKFVTEINTEGMEKKYIELGDTKESSEDISRSINKLKNLKR